MSESENIITLEEVCIKCREYIDEKITQEELNTWLDNIKIHTYLKLSDKYVCISELLFKYEMSEDNSLEWQICELEQNKLWCVLLKYTNIQTEGYEEYKTLDNYDLIYSTIGDIILLGCYTDYSRTIKMFDDIVNVYNIQSLLQIFENFDEDTLEKSSEDLKKQLEYLSQKGNVIDNLSKVILGSNK